MSSSQPINLLIGVILGYISPTVFPKECSYLWCLSMIQVFSYPLGERSFHLFVDLKQAIVFISGKISPQVLRCLHKPTKIISFLCWFFNNSVLLRSFHCILSFLPEALWYRSLRPIFSFCQDHLLSLLIHLTGVLSKLCHSCSLAISLYQCGFIFFWFVKPLFHVFQPTRFS